MKVYMKKQYNYDKPCQRCSGGINKYSKYDVCHKCRSKENVKLCIKCGIKLSSCSKNIKYCKKCYNLTRTPDYVICPKCNELKPRLYFIEETKTREDKQGHRKTLALVKGCADCRNTNQSYNSCRIKRKCKCCGVLKDVQKYFTLNNYTCNTCVRDTYRDIGKALKFYRIEYNLLKSEILSKKRLRVCCKCKELLSFENFHKNSKNPQGIQASCINCNKNNRSKWGKTFKGKSRIRDWNTRNREGNKARRKKAKRDRLLVVKSRGIFTDSEFKQILNIYNNTCLNCGSTDDICADHVIPLKYGGANTIDNIQPLCRLCNSSKGARHIDFRLFWIIFNRIFYGGESTSF
jgi:hypothetical protein